MDVHLSSLGSSKLCMHALSAHCKIVPVQSRPVQSGSGGIVGMDGRHDGEPS